MQIGPELLLGGMPELIKHLLFWVAELLFLS